MMPIFMHILFMHLDMTKTIPILPTWVERPMLLILNQNLWPMVISVPWF